MTSKKYFIHNDWRRDFEPFETLYFTIIGTSLALKKKISLIAHLKQPNGSIEVR